jgi:hypothetical protein
VPETVIEALALISKELKVAGDKDSGQNNTDVLWNQFANMRRDLSRGEAPVMPAPAGPAIMLP